MDTHSHMRMALKCFLSQLWLLRTGIVDVQYPSEALPHPPETLPRHYWVASMSFFRDLKCTGSWLPYKQVHGHIPSPVSHGRPIQEVWVLVLLTFVLIRWCQMFYMHTQWWWPSFLTWVQSMKNRTPQFQKSVWFRLGVKMNRLSFSKKINLHLFPWVFFLTPSWFLLLRHTKNIC